MSKYEILAPASVNRAHKNNRKGLELTSITFQVVVSLFIHSCPVIAAAQTVQYY
jgi:hypothetical protein